MASLSIRKMAELLGVAKSQVQRDAKRGMPMTSVEAARAWRLADKDPSRTVDGRIDRPQTSVPDAYPRAEAGMAAGPDEPPSSSGSGAEDDQADENTTAYRADRARNERIRADRAELELQQLRGLLVSLREVEQMQFTAGRITRDRMEMLPIRHGAELHAAVLAGMTSDDFSRRLGDHIRQALTEAAQAIEDSRRDDDDPD